MGKLATSPLPSRESPPLQSGGGKSEVAHKWAKWLRHPCRLGDPHRFRAGGKIRSGPLVGKVATSPLPSRGSPPAERGAQSEVAHKWAKWLRHPCRLGDPHRCRAGAMRQRRLGSHTPPCHRRMVITTCFGVFLAALQRRPIYHRQQAKSNYGRQTSRGSNSCDTQHTPCPARDLPNPPSGLDPSFPPMLGTDVKRTAAATSKASQRPP